MTDAIVVATQKAHNDWSDTKLTNKLTNYRDYTDKHWTDNIEDGNSTYNLYIVKSEAVEVQLNSPSDTDEALDQSRNYIVNNTSLLDYYDSVVVAGSRTFSDAIGRAYCDRAGTSYGVGYVAGDGGKTTAAHELAHNYGGAHGGGCGSATFESTELHHSIVGEYGATDCNNSTSYTYQGDWYSDCTRQAVRSYIDNNGL